MEDKSNYRQRLEGKLVPVLDAVTRRLTNNRIKVETDDGKIHWTRNIPPVVPNPPPVVVPPPPPPPVPSDPLLGRYRILRDTELPPKYGFGGKSRTASPTWKGGQMTPASCRIRGISSNGPISLAGQAMVKKLDEPQNTYGYVTGQSRGWVNKGMWPGTVEGLTFEDNFVDVIRVDKFLGRAYIRTWQGQGPEDDCVVHRFTNIDRNGNILGTQNPAGTGLGYIVLDYNGPRWGGPAWIELDKLVKV